MRFNKRPRLYLGKELMLRVVIVNKVVFLTIVGALS